MKKLLIGLVVSTFIAILSVQSVFAENIVSSALKSIFGAEEKVTVKLNGKMITFPDEQPFVDENSRTLVPIRFVAEAMGTDVKWEENGKVETVTLRKGNKTIDLKIGEYGATVNGQRRALDTAAIMKEDRTFVPLRFVSEIMGATVGWDESSNTVSITDSTITYTPTPSPSPVNTPSSTQFPDIIISHKTPTPIPTPEPTPIVNEWKNKEVPMTLVGSDEMPEGFIKPEFYIKHHVDGLAGYFNIALKNIEDYKDNAGDYAFKIVCLNYDTLNWTSGIPDIKRTDNIRYLENSFKRKYVNPYLWGSPSKDVKFVDYPELGEVTIQPGTVLEMQVEFYYEGLKQIYRDSVELKPEVGE